MKYVITDSCYWLGLVDSADEHHKKSIIIKELIKDSYIVFPFPCFYEIIRTKFVKNKIKLTAFESLLKNSKVKYIDDTKYKDEALSKVYELNKKSFISHSLTDAVIREMLSDVDLKLDYLVTYNVKDFSDICAKRDIEILNE
jgi:hypothetical protein